MSQDFQDWVGRQEEAADCITARQCRQMAATLEAAGDFRDGAALPPLWHWMGWTPDTPMSGLGPDGHPARGGFLPPIALERRMWAGGRLTFHQPLAIGEALHRRSTILKVAQKSGASGEMVFVTVGHEVSGNDGLAISEEQDIVYVAMPDRFTPPPPSPAPDGALWSDPFPVDTVRLFRFSALTFNAHRIHFDLPYAREVEKYPDLVVHGPLQAMALMGAACRHRGMWPMGFRFRGVRPAFHTDKLTLNGWSGQEEQPLATVNHAGLHCMQATAIWSANG
jgi:3-methylfumaryl-CoA hydratase